MRVLQLGINDRYGGACIAAYRQHMALLQAGVDSQMWVRSKTTNDLTVKTFTPSPSMGRRAGRISRRHWLSRQSRWYGIREEMFDDRSEHNGYELTGLPSADVLNLQFAWGFIDYPKFFKSLPVAMPIVVTMHEMAHFTGGCSYTGGCTRFHKTCGNCPKMERQGERDFSRAGWDRRASAYAHRVLGNLHFVANSYWLAAEAKKSRLLARLPVSVIHLGLDTNIYRPLNRSFAREVLRVPADQPVVSFAAASVNDERKGMKFLMEALRALPQKPHLLTWGRSFPLVQPDISHRHLGNIDNEHFMALAYNAADVFVMPSLEETFGQTALEAIACGTPVAAFQAGGIPETVRHEQTGLLCPVGDSDALRSNIERLLNDEGLWRQCSENGPQLARAEFSYEVNAKNYIALYQSLLQK
jgi:glycosyltransferase involved in cell wall biosynthesis